MIPRVPNEEVLIVADAKNTPPEPKAMTVRLSAEQAAKLNMVAEVNSSTVANEIRAAVTVRIEELRLDPVFQARLREHMERNRAILEALADE